METILTGKRPEDPISVVWLYFIPLTIYYFCIVSGEGMYQSNIFSVRLLDLTRLLIRSYFRTTFDVKISR